MIFTCHRRRFVAATCHGDMSQRFVASAFLCIHSQTITLFLLAYCSNMIDRWQNSQRVSSWCATIFSIEIEKGLYQLLNENSYLNQRGFFFSVAKGLVLGRGGGDLHMKAVGVLVISLRGVNFGFCSQLKCCGETSIICSSHMAHV